MQIIYKYPIDTTASKQTVDLPFGAKVIHVGMDPANQACLWAEVESRNTPKPVELCVVGTGGEPARGLKHVGSFLESQDIPETDITRVHVWHIYIDPSCA